MGGGLKIVKKILPYGLQRKLILRYETFKQRKTLNRLKKDIISYHKSSEDPEIKGVIDYLRMSPIAVFPYAFYNIYTNQKIDVFFDNDSGLRYVIHEGKKMFFKKSMSEKGIQNLYKGLLTDQDPNSPHLYLKNDFNLSGSDVIADIGAAEGNFTLSNIEYVKKAYLFESDLEWIEPLQKTFEPWKDKVVIIPKLVTGFSSETTLNFNEFYQKNKEISFLKIDIEGYEQKLIDSCRETFKEANKLKIAICTYHKANDEKDFKKQFSKWGYQIETSEGYMIFIYDKDLAPPYLRRGLLRMSKD